MISFDNTEIAFKSKSNEELGRAFYLFKLMGNNKLVDLGKVFLLGALKVHLPIKWLVRQTIYRQFCGGVDISDCQKTVHRLSEYDIGSLLNYSAEGKKSELHFQRAAKEVEATIREANSNPDVPFCVFKLSGMARFKLLKALSQKATLSEKEKIEYNAVLGRVNGLCKLANEMDVRIMIDAEESWIQTAIDEIAENMMKTYNKEKPIVYNTVQMYRKDRLDYLEKAIDTAKTIGFFIGVKLVRGAYMEKERSRAKRKGYASPIQNSKEETDTDFDLALELCIKKNEVVSICAGTHNEKSSLYLVDLMNKYNIDKKDPSIYSSQLLGMSDQISFNLANHGYNVVKFVPYGPVKEVIPYLMRRAEENTSISGQMGRELRLIIEEKKRRSGSGEKS